MISQLWADLRHGAVSLLYPSLCLNCETAIRPGTEPPLCVACLSRIAYLSSWGQPENLITDRLAGRLPLVRGTALLHFDRGAVAQTLIHALKYHNRPEIGTRLGEELGHKLKTLPDMQDVAAIIPVPIHPKRLAQRGYNQATYIAKGLAEVLGAPVRENALVRTEFKGSQTKLNNLERVANAAQSFAAGGGDFSGQHLLLVDDVITTGATLDFCGQALLSKHPGCRLSIAALAVANTQ